MQPLPDSYIPFGIGPRQCIPRQCIGKRFALLEAQSMLTMIVNQFTLLPESQVMKAVRKLATFRMDVQVSYNLELRHIIRNLQRFTDSLPDFLYKS